MYGLFAWIQGPDRWGLTKYVSNQISKIKQWTKFHLSRSTKNLSSIGNHNKGLVFICICLFQMEASGTFYPSSQLQSLPSEFPGGNSCRPSKGKFRMIERVTIWDRSTLALGTPTSPPIWWPPVPVLALAPLSDFDFQSHFELLVADNAGGRGRSHRVIHKPKQTMHQSIKISAPNKPQTSGGIEWRGMWWWRDGGAAGPSLTPITN